jgi:hypothetical protein
MGARQPWPLNYQSGYRHDAAVSLPAGVGPGGFRLSKPAGNGII